MHASVSRLFGGNKPTKTTPRRNGPTAAHDCSCQIGGICLKIGTSGRSDRVEETSDSKRFAFNYRAGSRYNTTALYQLRGDKWVVLRSPETDETRKPLERVMAAQLRKFGLPPKTYRQDLGDITRVDEWVRPDTAILYCSSSAAVQSKNESGERNYLDADFLFTLKFDADGNWKIVKTHQMSEKELEEEQ